MHKRIIKLSDAWNEAKALNTGESSEKVNRKLNEQIGAKAGNLARLRAHGFPVPDGFIVEKDVFQEVLRKNHLEDTVHSLLSTIHAENVEDTSKQLLEIIDAIDLEWFRAEIENHIDPKKSYAVRSSAILEDLKGQSFAGQYESVLHCKIPDEIIRGIQTCYASLYSPSNLHYVIDHRLPLEKLQMAVLIQEMVLADASGVIFTVNPVTGIDSEIVIEATRGTAEVLVSGQVTGERYLYDWHQEKWMEKPEEPLLSPEEGIKLVHAAIELQVHFGSPQDIEFCLKDDALFIIQSRPISSIRYQGYDSLWSTADFKDGGVSSEVTKPYMASLYQYIWEEKLREFIVDAKILKASQVPSPLSKLIYSKLYWNLSVVKKAMSQIPGYVERDFDQEYGIEIHYEGEGHTAKTTPASLFRVGKMALGVSSMQKRQNKKLETFLIERRESYQQWLDSLEILEDDDVLSAFLRLTRDEYMEVEGTYFTQIFLNTVYQALDKEKICKYLSESEYLSLLGGLDDISHLRPFQKMWDISRRIRKTVEIQRTDNLPQWKEHPMMAKEVEAFIAEFGYHSDRELDVSYPNYTEDPQPVIRNILHLLQVDDEQSPFLEQERQKEKYASTLQTLMEKAGPRKGKQIQKTVERMRKMLWMREELRDISTMMYHLIRLYTLRIAPIFVQRGWIQEANDIWYVRVEEMWETIEKQEAQLQETIAQRKRYVQSFCAFDNPNEIGNLFLGEKLRVKEDVTHLQGLGCNQGRVTAKARVALSIDEIDNIQPGEILVTQFTDTGWTPKFAILAGVITEFGGLLCHAAIVSREYGLPCIVHLQGATDNIPNGANITMDGATGQVWVEEETKE